jgi:hypothetical protein
MSPFGRRRIGWRWLERRPKADVWASASRCVAPIWCLLFCLTLRTWGEIAASSVAVSSGVE